MANVCTPRLKRWLGLSCSLVAGLMTGSSGAISVYAMAIKETFHYTQSQVELVSSVGFVGVGLSFLHSIIMDKFGYKCIYAIIMITSPLSGTLLYMATIFASFFSDWPVLVGLFLVLAYVSSSFMILQVTQIGVTNFSEKNVGKVVALYAGVIGLGKIVFCGFYEAFFVGELGLFFLTVGILWTVLGFLCFFLHRPKSKNEAETNIIETNEEKLDEQEDYTHKDQTGDSVDAKADRSIFRSPYVHLMFWSSVIFNSCYCTFLYNLTALGQSVKLENPLVLVYLMALCTVVSKVFYGSLYDRFPSDKCGFVCLYACYLCFVFALIIGLTWFDKAGVFLMTSLVGTSVCGGNSLPWTLLAAHCGVRSFSAITGTFYAFMVPSMLMFQMCLGHLYDGEAASAGFGANLCYGSQCFMWTFVLLLCATGVVLALQIFNQLCIKNKHSLV